MAWWAKRSLWRTLTFGLLGTMLLAVVAQVVLFHASEKPSGVRSEGSSIDSEYAVVWKGVYGAEPGDRMYFPSQGAGHVTYQWTAPARPRIDYYIVEGGEAKDLVEGRSPAHVYHRRDSSQDHWQYAVFLVRPSIPEGKLLPDLPAEQRPLLEDTQGKWGSVDDDLLMAGLDVAWVLHREGLSDAEWETATTRFRAEVWTDSVFATDSRPVVEVADGDAVRASVLIRWTMLGLASGLVWSAWEWSRRRPEDQAGGGGIAPLVHLARVGVQFAHGLVVASRALGVLIGVATALAWLTAFFYLHTVSFGVTAAALEDAILFGPLLLGLSAFGIWFLQHRRIRRTWLDAQRHLTAPPLQV